LSKLRLRKINFWRSMRFISVKRRFHTFFHHDPEKIRVSFIIDQHQIQLPFKEIPVAFVRYPGKKFRSVLEALYSRLHIGKKPVFFRGCHCHKKLRIEYQCRYPVTHIFECRQDLHKGLRVHISRCLKPRGWFFLRFKRRFKTLHLRKNSCLLDFHFTCVFFHLSLYPRLGSDLFGGCFKRLYTFHDPGYPAFSLYYLLSEFGLRHLSVYNLLLQLFKFRD